MSTVMYILFSALLVLVLGSVWLGINSIWAVVRRVNAIGDDVSEVKRYVKKTDAINDYLLRQLHLTVRWECDINRYLVQSVCHECYQTCNYPGPCCRNCTGSDTVRLGLTDKEIESFKRKLDEIDRHVIHTTH